MLNVHTLRRLNERLLSYHSHIVPRLVNEWHDAKEKGVEKSPHLPGDTGPDNHPTHRSATDVQEFLVHSDFFDTGPEAHTVYFHYHAKRNIVSLTIMPTVAAPVRFQLSIHIRGRGTVMNQYMAIEKPNGADLEAHYKAAASIYTLFESILRTPVSKINLDL